MLNDFKNFISKEDLFLPKVKILLAVSGGMDSVVMTDLFHRAGYDFGIAHCNFQLRGEESKQDQTFVKKLAEKYGVPCFCKRFRTKDFAEENGLSIQMAARTLRYEWFEKLLKSENYTYLTAHHIDDQVETFFINLLHGTGISGLHGILPKKNSLVHPMMFTYRKDIEEYASENNLEFRVDSSNKSLKYVRNRLRHQIIPQLTKLNPEFNQIINKNIERFREIELIYKEAIQRENDKVFFKRPNKTLLSIPLLKKLHPLKTFLYEFLAPYNFSFPVVCDIVVALDDISGKQFYSPTHRLIKDRDQLIITKRSKKSIIEAGPILIKKDAVAIKKPLNIQISHPKVTENLKIPANRLIAFLDRDKLKFPLELRKWKKGDYFYPLGMNTRKKISDFFIDNKFSIIDKENTWLLCSGKRIVWIVGYRIDNRFKVNPDTKVIIQLKIIE